MGWSSCVWSRILECCKKILGLCVLLENEDMEGMESFCATGYEVLE